MFTHILDRRLPVLIDLFIMCLWSMLLTTQCSTHNSDLTLYMIDDTLLIEMLKKDFVLFHFFRICFSGSAYFSYQIFFFGTLEKHSLIFFAYLKKVHFFPQIWIGTCTDVEITQSLLTTIVWSSESSFCSTWAH